MLSRRQTTVLILSLLESFVLSAHYAVFMPFYPNVAKDKGNTSFEIGTFFAVGSCVGLFGGPLIGILLKLGYPPKMIVIFGLTLSGALLMTHGFYKDSFEDGMNFFCANLVTRIVHSIGPVAATTAIYPIVAVELGEERGRYLPYLEAIYNMGLMIWPSLGAILYEYFGYSFPFILVGVISLVMCVVLAALLPDLQKTAIDDVQKSSDSSIIDFPLVLILTNIALCYLIIGFNDITLSGELKAFQLSDAQIGYCFAVATVCYGVCIYLWASLCITLRGQFISLVAGYVLTVLGLFFSAPCALVHIEATLSVRLLGQALMGMGLAALYTSSLLSGAFYLITELQMPDDVSTHGLYSSLIFFSMCFGYLVGHAGFAGFLLDILPYIDVLFLMILLVLYFSMVNVMNIAIGKCTTPRSSYESLDGANSLTPSTSVHSVISFISNPVHESSSSTN